MKKTFASHPNEGRRPRRGTSSDADLAAVRVPGAGAPVSNVLKLWNSLARWILSGNSGFAKFLRSLQGEPLADRGTATSLWPIPAPYPRWIVGGNKGERVNYKNGCREGGEPDGALFVLASSQYGEVCPSFDEGWCSFGWQAVESGA